MSQKTRKRTVADKSDYTALDPRIVKAIAHPLRHRLLLAFNERVASPNELAKLLDEPLGNVAYHTRILLDVGAIELVDTAQRRGATEHYYRAIMGSYFTDAQWATLPITSRRTVFAQSLQALFDDVGRAIAGDGFDHPQAHVSRYRMNLDEPGFDDVVNLLAETLERVIEIHTESHNRVAESTNGDRPTFRTEVGLLHFELVDAPRSQAKPRRKRSAT